MSKNRNLEISTSQAADGLGTPDVSAKLFADSSPFAVPDAKTGTKVAWNDQGSRPDVNYNDNTNRVSGYNDNTNKVTGYNDNTNKVTGYNDNHFNGQVNGTVNGRYENTVNPTTTSTVHDTNVNTANGGNHEQTAINGGSSAVIQGSQTRVDARALGLSRAPVLTNQCSDFAVQLGGGAGFIHGDVGLMTTKGKCWDALKTQADCGGAESISRANLNTTQAQMMWGDREHGMQNTRAMAELATAKSAQCADLPQQPPQPQQAVDTSGLATKAELEQVRQEDKQRADRVFEHAVKK